MPISNFRLNRNLTSYGKVQTAISSLIRGKNLFVNRKKIQSAKLLNIGCGENVYPQFVNLDFYWRPGIDVCMDITKQGYPIPDGSMEGVYTEHCLEHVPLEAGTKNLAEIYRVLRPGGTLRIVVPDGELYFTIYNKKLTGESAIMPYEEGYITPIARINSLFRSYGHQFIYDFETFRLLLEKTGFKDIKKVKYMEGRNKDLLIDTEWRQVESLYVEASK